MLTESTIIDPREPLEKIRKINLRKILKANGHKMHAEAISAIRLRQIIRSEGYDYSAYVPRQTSQIEPAQAQQVNHLQEQLKSQGREIEELRRELEFTRYQNIQAGAPKGDATYNPVVTQGEDKPLNEMSRAQLMKLGKERGLSLHNKLKKTDLVEMLNGENAA